MLGLQVVDLGTETLNAGQRVIFSIQDLATGNWVESDRVIEVVSEEAVAEGMRVSTVERQVDRMPLTDT